MKLINKDYKFDTLMFVYRKETGNYFSFIEKDNKGDISIYCSRTCMKKGSSFDSSYLLDKLHLRKKLHTPCCTLNDAYREVCAFFKITLSDFPNDKPLYSSIEEARSHRESISIIEYN